MNILLSWISTNPIPSAILLIAFGVVIAFFVAFLQGREISLWPPIISGKPILLSQDQFGSSGVITAISTRKSIRAYLNRPVEEEKINKIFEAARLAPSASNRQEWRFVIVRDPETRKKISQVAYNLGFIATAPVVIVACAESDGHAMPCGQLSYPIDVAIALDHITLAAVELGLGTCWVAMFDEQKVKQILGIPENIRVVELMPLGYPVNPSAVEKKRLPFDKIVKYDRW
jgi:nitroreductase